MKRVAILVASTAMVAATMTSGAMAQGVSSASLSGHSRARMSQRMTYVAPAPRVYQQRRTVATNHRATDPVTTGSISKKPQ